MSDQASEHILKHHVSLGSPPLPNDRLGAPIGSGTFSKFLLDGKIIYGILTAAHVARRLPLIVKQGANQQFIGLAKPSQTEEAFACVATFHLIYFDADVRYFHSLGRWAYRPDVAFIILGIDKTPEHELFSSSLFYELGMETDFIIENQSNILSGFFRGACNPDEVSPDHFLNTPLCLGGGETIHFDERAFLHYWDIPNTSGKSIAGASGGGFWRFRYDGDGNLNMSFAGVITGEGEDYDYIEAIASSYINETFLPGLKKQFKSLLPTFRQGGIVENSW